MDYKPYTELSPIKPNKPELDLEKGVLYMNGNSMQDLKSNIASHEFFITTQDGKTQRFFNGAIETIKSEPEEFDITNELKHTFWDIKPMSMRCIAEVKPDFINDQMILSKPIGPWEMTQQTKIQRRKHHKKRINKKWAKRYGYYTIEHVYEVLDLKPDPNSLAEAEVSYDATLRLKEARTY